MPFCQATLTKPSFEAAEAKFLELVVVEDVDLQWLRPSLRDGFDLTRRCLQAAPAMDRERLQLVRCIAEEPRGRWWSLCRCESWFD
jgi:hypothetical protein